MAERLSIRDLDEVIFINQKWTLSGSSECSISRGVTSWTPYTESFPHAYQEPEEPKIIYKEKVVTKHEYIPVQPYRVVGDIRGKTVILERGPNDEAPMLWLDQGSNNVTISQSAIMSSGVSIVTFYKEKGGNEMNWTATNIAIVAIICLVMVKLVIPRLTIKNMVKGFVRLVFLPFKRVKKEAETAWQEEERKE